MSNSDGKLRTPVAIIVFNRPHVTRRVYEVLRQVKPSTLFVIADGPRDDRPEDVALCEATRAIFEQVDWDCRVIRNYAAQNLGCGPRPASGISWVFEQVPEAIILEDDCLPHPTFFRYCEELLAYYREDNRIAHIGGTCFYPEINRTHLSYRFSRFPLCWGWASWRRAWRHFDADLQDWPTMLSNGELDDMLDYWLETKAARRFWRERFDAIKGEGKIHTWDYQWILACWRQRALSIYPNVNLVSNLGFGDDATHTLSAKATLQPVLKRFGLRVNSALSYGLSAAYDKLFPFRFGDLETSPIVFPLYHPIVIERDAVADAVLQRRNYQGGFRGAIKRNLKQWLLTRREEARS
ncbi:MAG: glycosyltransferase family 2 protein [Acidobacteria bacterium]|nr:glycosyltransferase family 2 protein [Acidobacteriota bacterium]